MLKKYLLLLLLIFYNPAFSAGTGSGGKEDYSHLMGKKQANFKTGLIAINKAKKYTKKGKIKKAEEKFNKAVKFLTLANDENPLQPDILNLLGFALRNVGDYPMAEIYYLQGLEIEPSHVGINEYLGELYIKTNRISLAKERLKVLETCKCEEFKDLKTLIEQQ
jgi:tetratricopeptide (TPR) repeat protein